MTRRFRYLAALLLVTACAPQATEADRAALIGIWQPTDGSIHALEFRADGDFDFIPAQGVVHRQAWSLPSKGSVTLTPYDGGAGPTTCTYSIAADVLTIGDGDKTCLRYAAYEVDMPRTFKRGTGQPAGPSSFD